MGGVSTPIQTVEQIEMRTERGRTLFDNVRMTFDATPVLCTSLSRRLRDGVSSLFSVLVSPKTNLAEMRWQRSPAMAAPQQLLSTRPRFLLLETACTDAVSVLHWGCEAPASISIVVTTPSIPTELLIPAQN